MKAIRGGHTLAGALPGPVQGVLTADYQGQFYISLAAWSHKDQDGSLTG